MHFKILVIFGFILHIYLHLCKATNLHRLFTIIFYWSKATFMVYVKKLYIYLYIYIYIYYTYILYMHYLYIIYVLSIYYLYILYVIYMFYLFI